MNDAASETVFPPVPSQAPQFPPSFFGWLCRAFLRLTGWRVAGTLPDVPKLVIIGAPHSSNWDAVWALAFKVALRLDVRFIIKNDYTRGALGPVVRDLGGIGIDRKAAHDVVSQMRQQFARRDRLWLGITPEGTRKKVKKWKSGFWHIARAANVPVLLLYFHYPEKTIGLGPLIELSDDLDADTARIREYYMPFVGRNRGTV
ncbi:MAG: lysophospholipid acyltransferase family protein [Rudaea sp.]|uniref:lysophospholipid acyltransferase family protein n=1 Tax=Rudaea sp. TaxID=2136325 RepID=UPI0039E36586